MRAEAFDCDPSVEGHLGTVALKMAVHDVGEFRSRQRRNQASQTIALINERVHIIGTPSFILVFLQFLKELELAKMWIRISQDGHPHDV